MGLFDPSTWSVKGFAQATYDVLDPVYGEDAPLEFVAEAVTPITLDPIGTITELPIYVYEKIVPPADVWLSEAIEGAADLATTQQQAQAEQVDIGDIVSDLFNIFSDPSTSPLTPYAEAYVDWYEGDTTTAEFISDPIGTTTAGVVDVITDVVGTDIVVGSIEAAATPLAAVLDPITEPIGEGIEKLIVPAAILGGAYLLLK